jgi:hypothetical protein
MGVLPLPNSDDEAAYLCAPRGLCLHSGGRLSAFEGTRMKSKGHKAVSLGL